jgi:WNK lysine deficient protein kinase
MAYIASHSYIKYDKIIGRGRFKIVYKAYDKINKKNVAWCEVPFKKNCVEAYLSIQNEIDILKHIKNKNKYILNIIEHWKTEDSIILITDLYSDNLESYIYKNKNQSILLIKKWIEQIIHGLMYLHQENIIHRDMKCSNILINSETLDIVISDFETSIMLDNSASITGICGSLPYIAPEVYNNYYTKSCDIYSLGMIILQIATNQVPYSEVKSCISVMNCVLGNIKPIALSNVKNKLLYDLIIDCINLEPLKRVSLKNILKCYIFHI